MKPSKSRVRRPREERKGKGGRRNWLTGGKENERVAALPKEVEKEKTSNREPRTRDTRSLSLFLRREKFHRFLLEKRERFRKEFHPFPLYGWFQKKKEGISRRKKRRRRRKRALSIPFLSKKTLYVRFEKYPSSSVSFREEQRYNTYKPRLIWREKREEEKEKRFLVACEKGILLRRPGERRETEKGRG